MRAKKQKEKSLHSHIEHSRPMCVWGHLMIDDLPDLTNATEILQQFSV